MALGFRHEAVVATVVLHCLPSTPQLPLSDAGWSSPVARQAHNLKAAGSNPAPATKHQQKPPARNAGGFCVEAQRSPPSQPALSRRPFASKRPAETYKSRGQASQAPEIINDVALYRTLRSGNPISTIVALIRLFSVRNAGLAFSIGRSTLAVVEFGRNANPCAIAAFASSCRPSRS